MNSFPITSREIILKCLPQRDPMVMVDHLINYSENSLTANHIVTEGRLFTYQFLTEPGLIEHMAQTIALHTGYTFYIKNKNAPVGYLGGISNLNIKRLPKLNECVVTKINIIQNFGNITLVEVFSTINNVEIAYCKMKTFITE